MAKVSMRKYIDALYIFEDESNPSLSSYDNSNITPTFYTNNGTKTDYFNENIKATLSFSNSDILNSGKAIYSKNAYILTKNSGSSDTFTSKIYFGNGRGTSSASTHIGIPTLSNKDNTIGDYFSYKFDFAYNVDDAFIGSFNIFDDDTYSGFSSQSWLDTYPDSLLLENIELYYSASEDSLIASIPMRIHNNNDSKQYFGNPLFVLLDNCRVNFPKNIKHHIEISKSKMEDGGILSIKVNNNELLKLNNIYLITDQMTHDIYLSNNMLYPTRSYTGAAIDSNIKQEFIDKLSASTVIGSDRLLTILSFGTSSINIDYENIKNTGSDQDPILTIPSNPAITLTGMDEYNTWIEEKNKELSSEIWLDNFEMKFNCNVIEDITYENIDIPIEIIVEISKLDQDLFDVDVEAAKDITPVDIPTDISIREDISKDLLNPITLDIGKDIDPVDMNIYLTTSNPFKSLEEVEDYINKTYLGDQQSADDFQLLMKVTEYSYWPVKFSIDNNYHIHIKPDPIYLGVPLYVSTNKQFLYGKYILNDD